MFKGIKHNSIMVAGSGWTIKQYADSIRQCIKKYSCKVIGINKMTQLCCPDYHLWTNRKQLSDLGSCIDSTKSVLMFGHEMPKKIIRKYHKGNYITVVYTDDDSYRGGGLALDEDHIKGKFRTAGCLAIVIAHLMEAQRIFVVGMDGFTLHNRKYLKRKIANQHCYGKGHTDDASWEECVIKDRIVKDLLNEISQYVNFQIITPTVFESHFNYSVLGVFYEEK